MKITVFLYVTLCISILGHNIWQEETSSLENCTM